MTNLSEEMGLFSLLNGIHKKEDREVILFSIIISSVLLGGAVCSYMDSELDDFPPIPKDSFKVDNKIVKLVIEGLQSHDSLIGAM